MNFILSVAFMVIVGAAIGGVTNYLAIKMLFRPYEAVYIGSWRLPFTPGLIPRRRDELAKQLGILVVDHLLTPEGIQKKFLTENFQKEITGIVQKGVENFLNKDETVESLLEKIGFTDCKAKTKEKLNGWIEAKYEQLIGKYRLYPIRSVLSPELLEKIDDKIPAATDNILQKGVDFFSGIEGELQIERMIDNFIRERGGMLGNMLQMIAGNVNLTDKIQREILRFLKNDGTKDMITNILRKELDKILDWTVEEAEEQFGKTTILKTIKKYAEKIANVDELLEQPISKASEPIKDKMVDEWVPQAVALAGSWVSERIGGIMEKLRLADVVTEQVSAFSVERVEQIVLLITSRELKMITYLGAILGGAIGFIQGIIVQIMN